MHFPEIEEGLKLNPTMTRQMRQKRMLELLYRQKLKVGDLGFSKQLTDLEQEIITYCGIPLNMAPEIMNGRPYTKTVLD